MIWYEPSRLLNLESSSFSKSFHCIPVVYPKMILSNKRKNQRFYLDSPSKINLFYHEMEGTPVDISKEGIRIRTQESVAVGTQVTLILFDGSIRCNGTVCWVTDQKGEFEAGLQLNYLQDIYFPEFLSNFPKNIHQLDVLLLTANEQMSQSVEMYLKLAEIRTTLLFDPEEVMAQLIQKPRDLIIIDESSPFVDFFLENPKQLAQFTNLPIVLLISKLNRRLVQFCSAHSFVEVLTKPIYVQDLLLRTLVLIEQASHYVQMEGKLKQAQQQLEYQQGSIPNQKTILGMLSQVTKESKELEKLIQLQEALLSLESIDEVTVFFQKWVLLNFETAINLWQFHEGQLMLLEDILIPFPGTNVRTRQNSIHQLIKSDETILRGQITVIKRHQFFLEVLSTSPSEEMIENLIFFMKVFVPVLQSKIQGVLIRKAYLEVEQALSKEKEARDLLNQELKGAAQFQNILIPQKLPKVPELDWACYYESAADLGGDWFCAYPLKNMDQIIIGIGDVVGHGAQAGLVTAIVSGFFSDFKNQYSISSDLLDRHQFPGPGAVLSRLNRVICETTKYNSLMTLCLCFIDTKTQQLTYASAGHNPLLLYRVGGHATPERLVKSLMGAGQPLGKDIHATYTEQSFTLRPGDSILCYTDGFTEYSDTEGEYYGVRRMSRLFSSLTTGTSQSRIDHMVHELFQFGNLALFPMIWP